MNESSGRDRSRDSERVDALLAFCDDLDAKARAAWKDYSDWIEGRPSSPVPMGVPTLDAATVRRFLTADGARYTGPCRDCTHDHDDHDRNGPCLTTGCRCEDWRPADHAVSTGRPRTCPRCGVQLTGYTDSLNGPTLYEPCGHSDVSAGLAAPGREQTVQVVLTMSAEDAQTFIEDWQYGPEAPVLTGGWQEHPVTVLAAAVAENAS